VKKNSLKLSFKELLVNMGESLRTLLANGTKHMVRLTSSDRLCV